MSKSKVARSKAKPTTVKVPPRHEMPEGLSQGEACAYLVGVLDQAEDLVVKSLPKMLLDIKRSHFPAFHAIDAIDEVRRGLRSLGGAS